VVRARSWVKGKVSVHSEVGDNVAIETLELNLFGLKVSMMVPPHGTIRHPPLPSRADDVFPAESILLTESTACISNGRKCTLYPFAVFLSAALSPSMEHFDVNDGSYCSVSYRLTATASISMISVAEETECTTRMSTLQTSRSLFVIGETPSMACRPLAISPSSPPIKRGKHHRGHLVVAVYAENTHVTKGDSVAFALVIADESLWDIEYIEASFVERIRHGKTVATDANDANRDGDGYLKDHTAVLRSYVRWLHRSGARAFRWPANTDYYRREDLIHAQHIPMQVHVPRKSRTSHTGKLIDVSHFIEIRVMVKDAPVHCHPKVAIPVIVFDRPLKSICGT
jgi:hypothetical protein